MIICIIKVDFNTTIKRNAFFKISDQKTSGNFIRFGILEVFEAKTMKPKFQNGIVKIFCINENL